MRDFSGSFEPKWGPCMFECMQVIVTSKLIRIWFVSPKQLHVLGNVQHRNHWLYFTRSDAVVVLMIYLHTISDAVVVLMIYLHTIADAVVVLMIYLHTDVICHYKHWEVSYRNDTNITSDNDTYICALR